MEHMDIRQNEVPDWQPALTDVRVRQALLLAMDRAGLTEAVNFGVGGSPADAFVLRRTRSSPISIGPSPSGPTILTERRDCWPRPAGSAPRPTAC